MTPENDAPPNENISSAPKNGGGLDLPENRATGKVAPEANAASAENILDENLDATNVEDVLRPRITISTLASMASLDIIIPGGGALSGLYDALFRSKEMNDDFSISNLGGTLEEYFQYKMGDVDASGQKRKDDDDAWDQYIEVNEQRLERERQEREAWSSSEHSLAGVEMTGEEWGQLANDVGPGGKLRNTLVQWYMKKGKTQAEAEKKADDDAEIYRIQSKPETQRTPEEQKKIDTASKDPEFRAATQMLKEQRDENLKPVNEIERGNGAGQDSSTSTRADVFDDGQPAVSSVKPQLVKISAVQDSNSFPSAPDLTEHHKAAVAATEPLDTPKSQIRVAALTPTPAPGGGLDV